MAGEPQRWREKPCAGRDTRVETVVYENQLGIKTIPANVTGGFALIVGIPSDDYDKFSVMPQQRGIDEYSHCQITEQTNSAVRLLLLLRIERRVKHVIEGTQRYLLRSLR